MTELVTTRGRLVVDMFMTIDQVMQAPGAPGEDVAGGFEHGGWQAPYSDAESGAAITDDVLRMDALLLGRRTYDIFAEYWPNAASGDPIGAKLNGVPKYVASRSGLEPTWQGTTVIADIATEVDALKRRHREIHLIGSSDLLQSLLEHDLVDELSLWLYPIVLGTGRRVFTRGIPAAFELIEAPVAYPAGSVHLRYGRAGDVEYGDMGA
jgi:dihydrofolate reductase